MASTLLCRLRGLTVVHSISTTVGEEQLVWSTAMYERSEKEMKRMRGKFRSLHYMPATFHRDVDERLVGSVQTQPMRAFHSCSEPVSGDSLPSIEVLRDRRAIGT
jgi:hypothetical protein